jgi:TolA-binding protein
MAKLGRVEALAGQNKYDDAIKTLTDLSALRDSKLPVDGVLMELARVCRKAGKMQEARAAFKRVVDEFPESGYVSEAKQQLATMG